MSMIPTARGDVIDSNDLGFTLITECVIGPVTAEVESNWPEHTFSAVPEEQRIADAVAILRNAKECGVDSLVDRVIPGIGRNVPRLKKVADQVSVNIIVATGLYIWNDLSYYFACQDETPGFKELEKMSEGDLYFREQLTKLQAQNPRPSLEELMVRDIEVGILDTGVRAGIIKIVTDHHGMTVGVRSVIRSASRAHRRTGAPITTHTGIGIGTKSGLLQQEALIEEGVDLTRVNIGHIDWTPPEVPLSEFEKILDRGSSISFDTLALAWQFPPSWREKRIERVVDLCNRGYSKQIMLSHDDSCYYDIQPQPSDREFEPYTEVSLDLLPKLKARGLSEEQITQMMIHNPRNFLESTSKGGY